MKVKLHKIIKSCDNCKYKDGMTPHTCDECDSLDTPDFYMWEYDSNKTNTIREEREKCIP